MFDRKPYFILGVASLGLLLLIYHRALSIPFFGDDFQWFFPRPLGMIVGNFLHHAPYNYWYRPLQATVLASIQFLWGMDTLPIRILHFAVHLSIGLLIYSALRYWKVATLPAAIAALFFIVAQASAFAVASNDLISQMMGSLFGVLTLWVLYRSQKDERIRFWEGRALALAFFALALFSKETSAGICASVFVLFFLMSPAQDSSSRRFALAFRQSVPFAVVGILYVAMRTHAASVMPSYGSGIYQLHFGTNILKNLGLFAIQSILPFSSATTMHALYDHALAPLSAIMLITALLAIFSIYAIWNSQRQRMTLVLILFAFFSLVPAILLNHVSECYLYNALPFVMGIWGFVIEFYWNRAPRGMAFGFAVILAVAFVANAAGSMQKSNALAEESARSQVLMPQLYPIVAGMPQNGRLYLINPVEHVFKYSIFAMSGFEPVMFADPWILYHTRRPDVTMYVLDSSEYVDSARAHPGSAYTMDMATLRVKPF